ncbi:hypothetical protein, partial [Amycolatopsis sp. NPDC059657]|uniref:hypothetical protein n=1 Tax=Amycolatopsis sp. NPDC059657 TaxID=3346899 RepID=UPI00367249AE
VTVTSVLDRGEVAEQTVYNLSVSEIHTYLVRAGADSLLVHNTCPKAGDPGHFCTASCIKDGAASERKQSRAAETNASVTNTTERTAAPVKTIKNVVDAATGHADPVTAGVLATGAAASAAASAWRRWRNK